MGKARATKGMLLTGSFADWGAFQTRVLRLLVILVIFVRPSSSSASSVSSSSSESLS